MENIKIRLSQEEYEINPFLFGHNFEHTRSCIFNGISAQMIRNRKFAGKGAYDTGVAADWYLIGNKYVYCTLDRYDPYVRHYPTGIHTERRNELNTQVIMNPVEGNMTGIGQDGLRIRKSTKYEIRVVLKGKAEKPIKWDLRITDKSGEKTYWKESSLLNVGEWQKYNFTYVADADDDEARFEITFSDRAEVKVGAVSMLPTDNFHGLRKDVISNLREIGPTMLRWPGGNFAGEYRWKDGLYEVDQRGALKSFREIETHPYTHGFDFHEINVDDFIALCREVNATPYITINLAWDSPEECAEFVEYCNGDETTEWGRKRAERGNREPYNVIYWSLGNEFGLGHMEGPNNPEVYSEKAHQCAQAMKAKDPRLILFASGSYNPEFDYTPWIERSIPILAGDIEYISYHNYVPRIFEGDCGGIDFTSEKGVQKTYRTITDAPDQCLKDVRDLRIRLGDKYRDKIRISYDEWNFYFTWFHTPGVMEGIYTALMLDMFCKNSVEIGMPVALYFQPVNEGAIRVTKAGSDLTANGQAFSIMKNHAGNVLIRCSLEEDNPFIRCLASKNRTTNEITITVINKDYDKGYQLDIEDSSQIKEAKLYEGECLFQGSKFTEKTLEKDQLIIPPHSIIRLTII